MGLFRRDTTNISETSLPTLLTKNTNVSTQTILVSVYHEEGHVLASRGIRGKGQGRLWIRDASPAGGQALSWSLTALPLLPADKETERPSPRRPKSLILVDWAVYQGTSETPLPSSPLQSLLRPHQEAPGHRDPWLPWAVRASLLNLSESNTGLAQCTFQKPKF